MKQLPPISQTFLSTLGSCITAPRAFMFSHRQGQKFILLRDMPHSACFLKGKQGDQKTGYEVSQLWAHFLRMPLNKSIISGKSLNLSSIRKRIVTSLSHACNKDHTKTHTHTCIHRHSQRQDNRPYTLKRNHSKLKIMTYIICFLFK